MIPPSDREDILCAMFESFCITSIRNFGRNLDRAAKNRQKHDSTGEESVEYLLGLLSTEDEYTADKFVLEVDGLPCVLENELLYNALLSLPDRERRVLLYDFWYDLKDKEISEKLEVTVRTVYNLRQRAFKKIRTYSTALVRERFRQINSSHIERLLDAILEKRVPVRNTKAYLLAALFDAPATKDNHYTMAAASSS